MFPIQRGGDFWFWTEPIPEGENVHVSLKRAIFRSLDRPEDVVDEPGVFCRVSEQVGRCESDEEAVVHINAGDYDPRPSLQPAKERPRQDSLFGDEEE